MIELKFDDCLIDLLLDWTKTSTIRKNTDLKPKDYFSVPQIDTVFQVASIKRIRFDEIDKTIAKKEGYLHENLLKRELKRIYPNIENNDLLYQIEFQQTPFKKEEK